MLRSACNPCLPPRSIRKSADSGNRPDSLNSCAAMSGSITSGSQRKISRIGIGMPLVKVR